MSKSCEMYGEEGATVHSSVALCSYFSGDDVRVTIVFQKLEYLSTTYNTYFGISCTILDQNILIIRQPHKKSIYFFYLVMEMTISWRLGVKKNWKNILKKKKKLAICYESECKYDVEISSLLETEDK